MGNCSDGECGHNKFSPALTVIGMGKLWRAPKFWVRIKSEGSVINTKSELHFRRQFDEVCKTCLQQNNQRVLILADDKCSECSGTEWVNEKDSSRGVEDLKTQFAKHLMTLDPDWFPV